MKTLRRYYHMHLKYQVHAAVVCQEQKFEQRIDTHCSITMLPRCWLAMK